MVLNGSGRSNRHQNSALKSLGWSRRKLPKRTLSDKEQAYWQPRITKSKESGSRVGLAQATGNHLAVNGNSVSSCASF